MCEFLHRNSKEKCKTFLENLDYVHVWEMITVLCELLHKRLLVLNLKISD